MRASQILIELFKLPEKIVEIHGRLPNGEEVSLSVKLHLLSDEELLAASREADRYQTLGRPLALRREILARAIEWIDGEPLEMPSKIKEQFKLAFGREPTPLEQRQWVLSQCQPATLQLLEEAYEKLRAEQERLVQEVKKKFSKQQEASPESENWLESFSASLEELSEEEPPQS